VRVKSGEPGGHSIYYCKSNFVVEKDTHRSVANAGIVDFVLASLQNPIC